MRVNVRAPITCTNVVTYVVAAGTGLTSGQNFAGLYNSAGTLIAATADQTTPWASGGTKTMALTGGPYSLAAGFYWVALLSNESAGSTPTVLRASNASTSGVEVGYTVATARAATNGAGTTLPGSITPASNAFFGSILWVALS
jgi:hypothetical protein